MNKNRLNLNIVKLAIFLLVIGLSAVFYGCGSSGNIADWADSGNVIRVSNLKGRVIAPINSNLLRTSTAEPLFSLTSIAGTKVFIEDNSNLFAFTDKDGFFIIPNVPEGKHRIIANIVAGTTSYRQRSDVITITGQYETQELSNSIELSPALYSVKIHVNDLTNSLPISATIKIWGFTFETLNGIANVGPFPSGDMSKEITISAIGYKDFKTLINFGEDYKSEIFLKMTPTTSTDSNQAPTIEIQKTSQIVRTNEEIGISGIGVDPEGDTLTWKWSASAGSFYNDNAQQTTFRAPETSGNVRISLTGTDSKGASGQAVLDISVEQGGSPGVNPQNKPPVAPNTPFPENLSTDMDGELLLTWNCSDPNNDAITYTVNFGKQGSELITIATNLTEPKLTIKNLEAYTKYFWQVTAYDVYYASTNSELWQFSTGNLNNQPPNYPTYPSPANLASDIEDHVSFTWSGGDPDGDPVTYQIYLATASTWVPSTPTNLKLIHTTNLLKFDYYGLERGAVYQWQIVATDKPGARTEGPVWQFSTVEPENHIPTFASITEPQSEATDVNVDQKLRWTAYDEDGDVLYYNVYFGTESDPPLVSESQASQIYDPGKLEHSTKYYWRIEVSDGRATNPKSDVWSFTTKDVADDIPFVVSVTPPANQNSPLKITFSEYINNSNESEALSFSPAVSGSWNWTTGNTVAEFYPSGGSWLPGSYNKFTLKANILEDSTGNKIETATESKFVAPSSVPVPTGYRSYAFPLEVAANKSVTISIPDLEYGKNSYVVAVAGKSGNSSVRASLENNPLTEINYQNDPTYSFRLLEKNLLNQRIKIPEYRSSARASVSSAEIGDIKEFFLNKIATSTAYPNNKIHAKLTKMSQNTLVYVDEAISDANKENFAETVLNTFDSNVLQKVRDYFGNEPSVGVDGESRISIVLVNIAAGNSTAGYYYAVDLFPRDGSKFKESNECKVIYIKYGMATITTFGTLAHEFQHMINFYQKNQSLNNNMSAWIDEEDWINEGLSKYSEEICHYGMLDGDLNTTVLIDYSMTYNNDLSLTYWGPSTINCYGQVYLFMHFLAYPGRYNSLTSVITKALASGNGEELTGYSNIEAVTNEPFKDTIGKYALSLLLNNYSSTSPTAYGLHNINLTGSYNGHSLPGYSIKNVGNSPISLSDMPYENSIRFFRKASNGSGDTTISLSTGNRPVTLWLIDERE